jgi:homoserine kinase
MRAAFDVLGCPQPPGLALRCDNRIPHGRGLGSSAAAIVAGVLAARALVCAPTGPEDVLPLANELEGHPDNVAPCLYGGLTIAWTADSAGPEPVAGLGPGADTPGVGTVGVGTVGVGTARAVRLEPLPRVRPVLFIPPAPVSTEVARGLLPDQVPHADAARNAGRAALLVAALTARPDALLEATEDRLHQDYRAPAMPETCELVRRLRANGVPAVVSGAGPSVLVFLESGVGLEKLDSTAKEAGIDWHISPLDVERQGASVTSGGPSVR